MKHLPNLPSDCKRGGYHAFIGLTGGLASGKSTALAYLRSLGAVTVDADALAHTTYEPDGHAFSPLVARFGPSILGPDGRVDRAALGSAVFGQPEALLALQHIVWPATAQAAVGAFLKAAEAAGPPAPGSLRIGVLEAALLLEAGWAGGEGESGVGLQEVWLVTPGTQPQQAREEAIRRAVARSSGRMTAEQAAARLSSQLPLEAKLAHPACTRVIDSSGPQEETEAQIREAWRRLTDAVQARMSSGS